VADVLLVSAHAVSGTSSWLNSGSLARRDRLWRDYPTTGRVGEGWDPRGLDRGRHRHLKRRSCPRAQHRRARSRPSGQRTQRLGIKPKGRQLGAHAHNATRIGLPPRCGRGSVQTTLACHITAWPNKARPFGLTPECFIRIPKLSRQAVRPGMRLREGGAGIVRLFLRNRTARLALWAMHRGQPLLRRAQAASARAGAAPASACSASAPAIGRTGAKSPCPTALGPGHGPGAVSRQAHAAESAWTSRMSPQPGRRYPFPAWRPASCRLSRSGRRLRNAAVPSAGARPAQRQGVSGRQSTLRVPGRPKVRPAGGAAAWSWPRTDEKPSGREKNPAGRAARWYSAIAGRCFHSAPLLTHARANRLTGTLGPYKSLLVSRRARMAARGKRRAAESARPVSEDPRRSELVCKLSEVNVEGEGSKQL